LFLSFSSLKERKKERDSQTGRAASKKKLQPTTMTEKKRRVANQR